MFAVLNAFQLPEQLHPSTFPDLIACCVLGTYLHSTYLIILSVKMSGTATPPPTSTGFPKLDAVKENVAAAADPTKLSGLNLYSRFAFAGAVCCSVTHGGLTPVDV